MVASMAIAQEYIGLDQDELAEWKGQSSSTPSDLNDAPSTREQYVAMFPIVPRLMSKSPPSQRFSRYLVCTCQPDDRGRTNNVLIKRGAASNVPSSGTPPLLFAA